MKNKMKNEYELVKKATYLTNQCLLSNNIKRAKKIISLVDIAFRFGNNQIKNLISTVFIHSVSTHLEILNTPAKSLLPKSLLQDYHQQINSSSL